MDLIGIAVGHSYHFLEHVYPAQNNGRKLLITPEFITRAFQGEKVMGTTQGHTTVPGAKAPPTSNHGSSFPGKGYKLD